MGAAPQGDKVIDKLRVRRLEVVREDGAPVGTFSAKNGRVNLTLYSTSDKGSAIVKIGTSATGAFIQNWYSIEGEENMRMNSVKASTQGISVTTSAGKTRFMTVINPRSGRKDVAYTGQFTSDEAAQKLPGLDLEK